MILVPTSICARASGVLEPLGRIGLAQMHGRLHGRQYVLGPMLGLASEHCDLRLAPLALGDVAADFRRADDFTLSVFDG